MKKMGCFTKTGYFKQTGVSKVSNEFLDLYNLLNEILFYKNLARRV
jgi:hypothetical protein